jgi:hypothetical protein
MDVPLGVVDGEDLHGSLTLRRPPGRSRTAAARRERARLSRPRGRPAWTNSRRKSPRNRLPRRCCSCGIPAAGDPCRFVAEDERRTIPVEAVAELHSARLKCEQRGDVAPGWPANTGACRRGPAHAEYFLRVTRSTPTLMPTGSATGWQERQQTSCGIRARARLTGCLQRELRRGVWPVVLRGKASSGALRQFGPGCRKWRSGCRKCRFAPPLLPFFPSAVSQLRQPRAPGSDRDPAPGRGLRRFAVARIGGDGIVMLTGPFPRRRVAALRWRPLVCLRSLAPPRSRGSLSSSHRRSALQLRVLGLRAGLRRPIGER